MIVRILGIFMIIVWVIGLFFIAMTAPNVYGAEPKQDTQQELTVGDKAKIAAGVCLFGLFWSDTKPEETEYIYDMDNGYVANPIPIGIIKKEKKP
jgi:ABC-type Fe3+ transport system substrate-binding protein